MARLRRGSSRATEHYAWPYVARWCPLEVERQRLIFTTVAAGYATHPLRTDGATWGPRCARLRSARLARMACDRPKVASGACSPAVASSTSASTYPTPSAPRGNAPVPVNYRDSFIDLWYWGRNVKVRWAAEYWKDPPRGGA